jgi:hypothetical protein
MKTASTLLKILAVLAAVAGVVFIVATYGDKIVAWAKNLLRKKHGTDFEDDFDALDCDDDLEDDDFEG